MNSLKEGDNLELTKDFTIQEIEEALRSTEASKALGPDGINAGVLRSLWPKSNRMFLASLMNFMGVVLYLKVVIPLL